MKSLNLLPAYQKQSLETEHRWLILHAVVGLVLVAVTVGATILTLARFVLINQYTKIKQGTSLVNVEHLVLEESIDNLNKKVAKADKIQANFSKWTALLSNLSNLMPPGVQLNYLSVNRASGAIRLNGLSPDRAGLLAAQAALENSGLLASLEAPLSNFLTKADIEFRLSGQLKPF